MKRSLFFFGLYLCGQFAVALDLIQRLQDYDDAQVPASALPEIRVLPSRVQERLEKNRVEWQALTPRAQVALLWDSGYVFQRDNQLIPVFVVCGFEMNVIDLSKADYFRACGNHNTATYDCGFFRASNICAAPENIKRYVKCSARNANVPTTASFWAEDGKEYDRSGKSPFPRIYRHHFPNPSTILYAIHLDPVLPLKEGCSDGHAIFPCVPYDEAKLNHCPPKESRAMNNWLLQFQKASSDTDAEDDAGSSTRIYILIVCCFVTAIVIGIVVFLYKRRRAQKAEERDEYDCDREHSMNTKSTNYLSAENLRSFPSAYDDDVKVEQDMIFSHFDISPDVVLDATKIRVVRSLATGSFGEVLLAKYTGIDVAIKKLHSWSTEEAVDDFMAEVKLLKSLRHPNIIQFMGVSIFSDLGLCSICEYVERGDLTTVLKDRSIMMTWEREKHAIGVDIASGLLYLHQLQPRVIHRDLKSKNILISASFKAKLADFGLSREIDSNTMSCAGSNLWLAPEIFLGEKYTEKADIFSFGIVLSEIDTHKLPYSNGEEIVGIAVARKVAVEGMRPRLSPMCPPYIRNLARKCTDHDPRRRPTAEAIISYLQTNDQAMSFEI